MKPESCFEDGRVSVHRLVVGPIDNNVFIVSCQTTGNSVLIDAADEAETLISLCREYNVSRVLETHGHWDHTQAVPALRRIGLPVAVGAGDIDRFPEYDEILKGGESIPVGAVQITTISTPGHTPGSTCFQVEGSPLLFTGDTLFPGGPGATHFLGGDFPTIIDSLEKRIFPLPDETVVLPGHGDMTTIARERPHLPEWKERGW